MKIKYIIYIIFLLLLSLLMSFVGPHLDLSVAVNRRIFINLRINRVIFSFLVGAMLSLGGLSFQTLFQNSLASPYTLGIASGASLGSAIMIIFGFEFSYLGMPDTMLGAFIGAIVSTFFIYFLALKHKEATMYMLLLAGVAVNYSTSSLIMLLQYFGDFSTSFRIARWTMGSLDIVKYLPIIRLMPFFILLIFIIFYHYKELDLMLLGEEFAMSRGVDVRKIQIRFFWVVSLSIGAVVSISGPIGFVGLMVPHMVRKIFGVKHNLLGIMCIFFGGAFLTLCDTIARAFILNSEVPVGVITSLLGGPFFIYLLLRNKK